MTFKILLEEIKDEQDSLMELYELLGETKQNIMSEFWLALTQEKPQTCDMKSRQKWEVIPFSTIERQWNEFMRYGSVKPNYIKTIESIEKLIISNILKVETNTLLGGHTSTNPKEEWEEFFGDNGVPKNMENYYKKLINDYCYFGDFIEEPSGQMRISDYAMDKLLKSAIELKNATTPESKLAKIDRIFNIVHQRSDIAAWFVEGGSKSLSKLSGLN